MLHIPVKLDVQFSITARQDKKIRAAIEAVDEDAWRDPVLAVVPGGLRRTPGSQLALFTTWDYHAFVTNPPGTSGLISAALTGPGGEQ